MEADAAIELAGSIPGTLELSRTRTLRNAIRIECERGWIDVPLSVPGPITLELDGVLHRFQFDDTDPYPVAFSAQLADFLEAVESGNSPIVTGADGLAVLELIDAAYATRAPLPQPWVTEAV